MLTHAIARMVQGTPKYVWVILSILIIRGIKSLRPQRVFLPALTIVPLLFIFLKFKSLLLGGPALHYYIAGMASATCIGWINARSKNVSFERHMTATLPGSPAPLIMFLSFFATKYTFGFLRVTNVQAYNNFLWLDSLISGTVAGFLLGAAACYIYRYYHVTQKF